MLDFWTRAPFVFWSVVFFVFGTVVGSFLNVCIHRMPLDLSLAKPGSQCPKCGFAIPWRLNIPIVSWLWLRGKCRQCAASISPRYLGVELLTGLAFLASWLAFGVQTTPGVLLAVTWGFVLAGLIVATFIDSSISSSRIKSRSAAWRWASLYRRGYRRCTTLRGRPNR